jgi:hypothetical protein
MLAANRTTESNVLTPTSVGLDVNEFTFPETLSLLENGITTGKEFVELYRDMFYYIRSFLYNIIYFLGGMRPCLRKFDNLIANSCFFAIFFVRGLLEKHVFSSQIRNPDLNFLITRGIFILYLIFY